VGNKILTDTGPVHSPISRHDAGGKNKQKKAKTAEEPKKNHTKTTKPRTKQNKRAK
jgi:hypothetical protein